MAQVDLLDLTKGKVRMLSGHPRGLSAREYYNLDKLEGKDEVIVVIAPDKLDTITPSFVQGFFGAAVANLGRDRTLKHYDFSKLPSYLAQDLTIGIDRLALRANLAN